MTSMKSSVTAVAPCSTANLGPGYDVFGLALDAMSDRVTIARARSGEPPITIKMLDDSGAISVIPGSNSAGRVVERMAAELSISDPVLVRVKKGVPAGYGLGSSAASAAAAAVAFNTLFRTRVGKQELVEYAAEGEIASAGTKHYDNVSASVLGGFVITSVSGGKKSFISLMPPRDLVLVVAIPLSMKVPEKKTEAARQVLPQVVPLKDVVHNVSSASTIVAGFALKDPDMIARAVYDVIVEPARKHLVPGYEAVKRNALAAGALGVTISGAGPSMIAFLNGSRKAKNVAASMKEGFATSGIESRAIVCRPSGGARVIP